MPNTKEQTIVERITERNHILGASILAIAGISIYALSTLNHELSHALISEMNGLGAEEFHLNMLGSSHIGTTNRDPNTVQALSTFAAGNIMGATIGFSMMKSTSLEFFQLFRKKYMNPSFEKTMQYFIGLGIVGRPFLNAINNDQWSDTHAIADILGDMIPLIQRSPEFQQGVLAAGITTLTGYLLSKVPQSLFQRFGYRNSEPKRIVDTQV